MCWKIWTVCRLCLRVSPETVVWISDTFNNDFEFANDFTNYLMESCYFCLDEYFSIEYF